MTQGAEDVERRLATFRTTLQLPDGLLELAVNMKCDRLQQPRRRLGRLFRFDRFFDAQRQMLCRGLVLRVDLEDFAVGGGRIVVALELNLKSAHGGMELRWRLTIPQADFDFLNRLIDPAFQMQHDRSHQARRGFASSWWNCGWGRFVAGLGDCWRYFLGLLVALFRSIDSRRGFWLEAGPFGER